MSERFLGYTVAIDCGRLGNFKGKVVKVTSEDQSITLGNPERNGVRCTAYGITLRAQDILSLEIISATPSAVTDEEKNGIEKEQNNKPKENGTARVSELRAAPRTDINRSPQKREKQQQQQQQQKYNNKWKDKAAFGSDIDHFSVKEDFDFEKNLALFDKKAVYEEINAVRNPNVTEEVVNNAQQKFRHDENVIESSPVRFRQIKVPETNGEYVTDEGLVIPCISLSLRDKLFGLAERVGLSFERQAELLGRAATEMALQLVGGGHRMKPTNTHQWPTVVVLCGGHNSGVYGANCARQLASHGIRVLLLAPDSGTPIPPELYKELSLFRLTKNPILSSVTELPAHAVDLIILAVDDPRGQGLAPSWFTAAAAWANECRAPVLALDPPANGSGVETKVSLVGGLPLSYGTANGNIYLCNLGIPVNVYHEVGINYNSPFGPKFVIPLHLN